MTKWSEPSVSGHAESQLLEPLDEIESRRVALGLHGAIGRHERQHVRPPRLDFALQILRAFAEEIDHGPDQISNAGMPPRRPRPGRAAAPRLTTSL